MEVEKKFGQKIKKFKVKADTTIEEVKKQLEFTEQFTEFSTTISSQTGFSDIFSQLNFALFHQKELKKLNITLKYLDNITFEDTIYKLKGLLQLTILNLSFQGDIYFSKSQSHSISTCLFQFPMLTKLKLDITAEFIDSEIELYEFYKSNIQLTSIHFVLSEVKEGSNILNSLLRGIRFQKNLESFKLRMNSCFIRASVILDILGDEFTEVSSLKKFGITFEWKIIMTRFDFIKLGNLLKNFTKLEKLSLTLEEYFEGKNIGFEDDLLKLTHLKEINLRFKSWNSMNWTNIVGNISQIESLKSVKLELTIKYLTQIGNDILSFGQSLAKIQHLEELQISFSYSSKINIYQMIEFMSQLKSARDLKSLKIYNSFSENSKEKSNYESLDFKEFMAVLNNLEKFTFSLKLDQDFDDQKLLDNIFNSIKNAQKLQSIQIEFNAMFQEFDETSKYKIQLDGIFSNKKNLKQIDLSFKSFSLIEESHLLNVFKSLEQTPQLSQISFEFKCELNFSFQLFQELSQSLIQLQQLKDLKIIVDNSIQLNNDGIIIFADCFSSLQALRKLQLTFSKDSISLSALNHLASSIRYLKKLQDLQLIIDGDQFAHDEDEKSFGDSFEFNKKLKNLELRFKINNLQYKNMVSLIQSISKEKRIETIYLDIYLPLNHNQCTEIQDCFTQLKNLQSLYLQFDSISQLALTSLFTSLPELRYISQNGDFTSSLWSKKKLIKQKKSSFSRIEEQKYNKVNEKQKDINDLVYWTSQIIKIQRLLDDEAKENADIILPYLFENLSFLNEFSLDFNQNNQIGVDFSCKLFSNFSKLQNLSCLRIRIEEENQIGSESLNVLGTTLTKLKLLDNLMIEINFIQNNIFLNESESFYKDLSSLSQLKQLDVSYHFKAYDYSNYDSYTTIVEKLFESLSNLANLKNLKIVITPINLSQNIISILSQILNSQPLKQNLMSLYFYIKIKPLPTSELLILLKQCFKQLNHLQVLRTSVLSPQFPKQLRLVSYEYLKYYS